jgi:hypothetical protein
MLYFYVVFLWLPGLDHIVEIHKRYLGRVKCGTYFGFGNYWNPIKRTGDAVHGASVARSGSEKRTKPALSLGGVTLPRPTGT